MLTAEINTDSVLAVTAPWHPGDGVVCPFCGSVNAKTGRCPQCTLEDNPATRAAAKTRDGFWYVLTNPNIAARGMTFQTLLSLVHRGIVTPESIVRGPLTHQLWRHAGKVKNLSREMGFCFTCGEPLGVTAEICPHCNRSQTLPPDEEHALTQAADRPPFAGRQLQPAARSVAGQRYVAPAPPEPEPQAPLPEPTREFVPRRLPKEDLLTPTHVAKAFSIPFNFNEPRPIAFVPPAPPRVRITARTVKIGAAVLLALVAAGALRSVLTARWTTATARTTTAWMQGEFTAQAPQASPVSPAPQVVQASPIAPQQAAATPARFIDPPAPAPASTLSALATVPAAVPAPPAAEPTPAASPADDVQSLWASALDAESRRDFVAAVRNYERIRSLPSNAWPIGLSTRLKLARTELVAGTY